MAEENSLGPSNGEVTRARPEKVNTQPGQVIVASSFSGPLPPPEVLEGYDRIFPGLAERLVRMAEKQSDHRMELEKKAISAQLSESSRGQIFGLIIGLTGLILSSYVIVNGYAISGSILGGATLVALVSVFVVGKQKMRAELQEKAPKSQREDSAKIEHQKDPPSVNEARPPVKKKRR
jgi:uncharacterized membrane protein